MNRVVVDLGYVSLASRSFKQVCIGAEPHEVLAWIPTEGNATNPFGVVGEAIRREAAVMYGL